MGLFASESGEEFLGRLAGNSQVERVGTQFNLVIPFDLAVLTNVHLLKKVFVVPNLEDASSCQV